MRTKCFFINIISFVRHRLRIQHLVEKEKLVLAVEQEILRVHGRAERAVANQVIAILIGQVTDIMFKIQDATKLNKTRAE